MIARAFPLLLAWLPVLLPARAGAQVQVPPPQEQTPLVVLTDTVEYCDQLQRRVLDHHLWPDDVKHLYAEGRQMCDHGEVRGGINRLRRALRILNHHTVVP